MQQLYRDIKVRWLTRNVYCLKRRKTIQNGSPIISTEKHDVYVSAHISSTLKSIEFAYCKLAFSFYHMQSISKKISHIQLSINFIPKSQRKQIISKYITPISQC